MFAFDLTVKGKRNSVNKFYSNLLMAILCAQSKTQIRKIRHLPSYCEIKDKKVFPIFNRFKEFHKKITNFEILKRNLLEPNSSKINIWILIHFVISGRLSKNFNVW